LDDKHGMMVAVVDGKLELVPLESLAGKIKPINRSLWEMNGLLNK
jgi:hypothetical protein